MICALYLYLYNRLDEIYKKDPVGAKIPEEEFTNAANDVEITEEDSDGTRLPYYLVLNLSSV